jgi:hypothetical protein
MPFTFTVDQGVHDISLSEYKPYIDWHENSVYWSSVAGYDMYKLLSFLSKQMPRGTKVLDIGTYVGMSALALSTNPGVTVYTYDILDCIGSRDTPTIHALPNIFPVLKNGLEDLHLQLDCPLIVLDVDPHDGIQERVIIQRLLDLNYKGIVLCDDIWVNEAMREFWESLKLKKIDCTKYGHVTGTGILVFDPDVVDVSVRECNYTIRYKSSIPYISEWENLGKSHIIKS